MNRKVAVFTGTRAEYGLLHPLIVKIEQSDVLSLALIVSGSHLSHEFGFTIKEIEADQIPIAEKIEVLLSSNSAVGVAKSMGLGLISYSEALSRQKPDVIVILGDRFEALAIAQAALLLKIPIIHIHGGEITQGAYDDAIRHAITKLSLLHLTSTEVHKNRVIQLGEHPERVHNVGAIGLDGLTHQAIKSRDDLSRYLNFDFSRPFALVTYHPVSLAEEHTLEVCTNLFDSVLNSTEMNLLITYPNADNGGRDLITYIEDSKKKNSSRICVCPSLGHKLYASALAHCELVIGNSSSGIIEAPIFNKASVNIGLRQLGRESAESVFHCDISEAAITQAISKAIQFTKKQVNPIDNPYGSGETSQHILNHLIELDKYLTNFPLKAFHDIKV